MPRIPSADITPSTGSRYPAPFHEPCMARSVEKLGDAGGLTQFCVSLVTLPPGAWSSQRHWHSVEDELVTILSGQPTLIDDHGETQLSPGDVTTHRAGDNNGHHMINQSEEDVVFLVVGSRSPETDTGNYPDIDLHLPANGTPTRHYERKDGSPY